MKKTAESSSLDSNDAHFESESAESEEEEEWTPVKKVKKPVASRLTQKTEKSRKHYAICGDCDRVYQQKESYLSHMMKVHEKELPGLKRYACNDCDNVEYTLMSHKYHVMQHTGERYECDICSYKSRFCGDVSKHKKRHHKK